jgi:hypothetical protein
MADKGHPELPPRFAFILAPGTVQREETEVKQGPERVFARIEATGRGGKKA